MAKKSAVEKNNRRKRMVAQKGPRRDALRAKIRDRSLPIEDRFQAVLQLSQEPRDSARTRIRNRCELSGRPRGYDRKLRMSRIALRDLASMGQVPGVVKSSW
ncbi:30S ribosomal protein S14 [Alphaproteobacteria bacterium]|jgi:small subunit ribosomal protein S14|nr:30S ribosomal protein S14 [Alphaproteobacteria bacterium]NCF48158.1 30S ribosomal protein S14 [Bacteroidota bacterium]